MNERPWQGIDNVRALYQIMKCANNQAHMGVGCGGRLGVQPIYRSGRACLVLYGEAVTV